MNYNILTITKYTITQIPVKNNPEYKTVFKK